MPRPAKQKKPNSQDPIKAVRKTDFDPDEFVKVPHVCGLIKVTPQRLRTACMDPPAWPGPPFYKTPSGGILFLWGEVLDWVQSRHIDPAKRMRAVL